ncbi:hypothetical protein KPH14_013003, partial [Odynerus spinipes]
SLSPTLFSLMIHDIDKYFEENGHNRIIKDMEILLFGDDLVIIGSNPMDLQEKTDTLFKYCQEKKLEVNIEKTKILECKRTNRKLSNRKIKYDGVEIEKVKSYTYLGIPFSQNGTFKMATEHFTSKTRMAIGSIWKPLIVTKTNNFEAAKTLFNAIIKSTMLYDVGIWGLQYTAEMERVAVEFEKRLLNVPKYTPGYMIRLETGRTHLDYDTIKKAFSFCTRLANMREGRLPRKCWE